jgi:hypothetical protein
VLAQVDSLLAGGTAAHGNVQVDLRVASVKDGHWRLDATIRGPHGAGQRSLDAADCRELADAAALIAAIALRPDLARAPPAEPDAPVFVVPPPPGVVSAAAEPAVDQPVRFSAPVADVAPPLVTRRPDPLRWPLGVRIGAGLGALPGVTAVLRLSAGVRRRRWGVELTQSFWLPRDFPAGGDPHVGGKLWLWAAGLRGCGIAGPARVEVPLCAGIEAGTMVGRGIGDLAVVHDVTSAWVAASAGPGLRIRVARRLAVTLGIDLLVILGRPRLQVVGRGTVCCDAPVGMTASAGLEVRLP